MISDEDRWRERGTPHTPKFQDWILTIRYSLVSNVEHILGRLGVAVGTFYRGVYLLNKVVHVCLNPK